MLKNKNIENITIEELKELSLDTEFTELWHIKKDDIEVCKNCEFRYMCVDARNPIKNNNGEYYFEEECPYNPYIAKWECEEGYVPVEGCGVYNEYGKFIPDHEKITILNAKIWGE